MLQTSYSTDLEEHRDRAFSMALEDIHPAQPELFRQDVMWPYFERLRRDAPVHLTRESQFGPYWSVSTHEAIMAVDTNHHDFSSSYEHGGIVIANTPNDFPLPMFIAMDPPAHDVQRKTVQPAVNPAALLNYEPLIRERTRHVLDRLPVGEPFDWVQTVSVELTTMMLATLFGFPFDERRKLTRWSDVATGKNNPAICESEEQWRMELMQCLQYFSELRDRAASEPPQPNLISILAHGEETKDMSGPEFLGNIVLLIVGGNDTTRNSMSASILTANTWPDEYDKLRADPGLIPNFTSEVIRWQTPLAHMRRTAVRDVEIYGQTIREGDKVVMWYLSGNRDDALFHDAHRMIADRENARRHIAFGFGIHRCVGNRLAEQQIRILWEELLQRYPDVRVLEAPERTPSVFVKGYTRLIVEIPKKNMTVRGGAHARRRR
ncbi:MAG: cytochrome P450 [Pseudomonadota bacterium]